MSFRIFLKGRGSRWRAIWLSVFGEREGPLGGRSLRFHHIYGSLRNHVRTFRMTCRKSSQRVVHAVPRRPWRDGFRRRGRLPAPIVHCRPKDKAWRGSVAPCGCHLILPSNWTHCISQDLTHGLVTGRRLLSFYDELHSFRIFMASAP